MVIANGKKPFEKKNGNITDFFKPFARAHALKRPAAEGPADNLQGGLTRRSKSPKLDDTHFRRPTSPLSSSGVSTLTPISSDATLEPPSDLPNVPEQASSAETLGASSGSGPPPSFSSQRVIKNGEIVVTNSDESGSESSLADLEEILRPRRRAVSSSPLTEPGSSEPELPETNSLKQKAAVRTMRRTRSSKKKDAPLDRKYKFSLEHLLERTGRETAEDEAYERALDLVGEVDAEQLALGSGHNRTDLPKELTTTKLVSKIQPKDPDDVDKLMQALQRTEALQFGSSWSFFDESRMSVDLPSSPSLKGLSTGLWGQDPVSIEIAFLNGTAADIAATSSLPREILDWIFEYSYFERREDLRQAYLLVAANAIGQAQELLGSKRLAMIMSNLGACSEVLDAASRIQPKTGHLRKQSHDVTSYSSLSHFLLLVGIVAKSLSTEARAFLLYSLLCMCFDSSLVANADVLFTLQNAISALVDEEPPNSQPEEISSLLENIYCKTDDEHLQLQLVRTLPTHSPACCVLRRKFALAFFFKDKSYLLKEAPLLPELSQVALHLRAHPEYTVRGNMDFIQLGARMSLLDVGTDDGDRPNDPLDADLEKGFNKEVDELSKAIRDMSSRITDSGASHMSRTEAKEIMVAFDTRLQYAVRTRPKPKTSIFGDIGNAGSRDYMKRFTNSAKPVESAS